MAQGETLGHFHESGRWPQIVLTLKI